MAANNWSTIHKEPLPRNGGSGILVYMNVGGVRFEQTKNGVITDCKSQLAKIAPPKLLKDGCVFGAAPLTDTCYSHDLVSKLSKIKGKETNFLIDLVLPENAKTAFELASKLDSKSVLSPWYLDQAVSIDGNKSFISGNLKLIKGPLCADFVRLAAAGFDKSLLEQMKILSVSPSVVNQFEKAFDLVLFWQFVLLLDDLIKETSELFAVGKACEIKDLTNMCGDPRIKLLIHETFDSCFPNSNYKKAWKELIL